MVMGQTCPRSPQRAWPATPKAPDVWPPEFREESFCCHKPPGRGRFAVQPWDQDTPQHPVGFSHLTAVLFVVTQGGAEK